MENNTSTSDQSRLLAAEVRGRRRETPNQSISMKLNGNAERLAQLKVEMVCNRIA